MRKSVARFVAIVSAGVMASAPTPVPLGSTAAAEPVTVTMQVTWTRPGVGGTLAPPAAVRVGDRVTIAFTLSGLANAGCSANFSHLDAYAWMAAGQSSASIDGAGYCTPWTFVVPPIVPGSIVVTGEVAGDDSDGEGVRLMVPEVNLRLESGGAHRPYESNYPVASWAVEDFLGTTSPSTNMPIVIPRPPGATRLCTYEISGEFTSFGARLLDREACADWEVTLPDPRPEAYFGSPFGRPWEASIRLYGGAFDALTSAATWGYAFTPVLTFGGNGGDAMASNLPTAFVPETTHPRYVLTGSTITIDPIFLNVDLDGECEVSYQGPVTPDDGIQQWVPFTNGACEPLSFVAPVQGVYGAGASVYIGGEFAAGAGLRIDVIDPMPPPEIEVDTAIVGEPFEVTSSVADGVPAEFEITLSQAGVAGLTAAADTAATCASGALDFIANDRSATGSCMTDQGGSHQVTVEFQDVTGATRSRTRTITVYPFPDIVGNKFANSITWLAGEGITAGCSASRFCPDGLVTRGQMATFLSRALNLPATTRDYFTDDETNKHEAAINRLRAAGITAGCSATRFCPDGLVTRAQMATFMARAFHLPATTRDYFTDDETNKHEAAINRLRAAGITSGCGGTRFCPEGIVTRGQMAAFLHRAMTD